uniref:Uncharacterized protein n=1 Tax=Chromulina nebulosa TaxID=96789 RepID=A0A7S0SWT7_9STRA|mmetsp:Transcript_4338/g.3888  ORF Transcript_4338/g.3888 Transcript_4338/m.3888 type:complete len:244 (+) Transcript_4338:472-1203(+)
MREFISPILVGVVHLMLNYLRSNSINKSLSMVCKKLLCGRRAYGSVDYVLVYDSLNIIITEANKQNINQGIIQNLLQQRASLDFLSNILVDYNLTGNKRKQMFDEVFRDVSSVPTYGIVSTGDIWVLTMCKRTDDGKTIVIPSKEIIIKLDGTEQQLKDSVQLLLSKLVYIVFIQIDKINQNESHNKRRRTMPSDMILRIEASMGNELIQEIENDKAEDDRDECESFDSDESESIDSDESESD